MVLVLALVERHPRMHGNVNVLASLFYHLLVPTQSGYLQANAGIINMKARRVHDCCLLRINQYVLSEAKTITEDENP